MTIRRAAGTAGGTDLAERGGAGGASGDADGCPRGPLRPPPDPYLDRASCFFTKPLLDRSTTYEVLVPKSMWIATSGANYDRDAGHWLTSR